MYFKVSIYISIILLFVTSHEEVLLSQAIYQVQYPLSTSAYAGADINILINHELSSLDIKLIPSRVFINENAWSSTGNILYRLIRMSTYNFYMSYIPVIIQHEYFGHLSRARQLHAANTRFEIYLFPPSGGRAFFGNHRYNPLTEMEQISEYIGGMEANSIMAEKIRVNSLQYGTMSFQDVMLYLGARTDFSTYVLLENNGSFDDIRQYLNTLNNIDGQEKLIERNDLVLPAILSTLLDPYTIQAAYSLIGKYVINNHSSFASPPMFQIGNLGLTPYYCFEPSVYGPQHCLNGYISTEKQLFSFSLHKAAFNILHSYGLQVAMYRFSVIRDILSLDLDGRYWHSEPLSYHNNKGNIQSVKSNGTLLSAKLYLKSSFPVMKENNLIFTTGFSMKSPGYTQGYPLVGRLSFNIGIGYTIST